MTVQFSLWNLVRDATERAMSAGALQPIRTRQSWIADGDVRFLVRVVESLSAKPKPLLKNSGQQSNPFLPYDERMYVADVPPQHVALLNKFQVVDQHVLIVTRQFEPQQSPLTVADFEALLFCLEMAAAEREGLVFYNGGPEAGASQPHKHLQMVPLPLTGNGASFPLERLWMSDAQGDLYSSDRLPFEHSIARLTTGDARVNHELYLAMLRRHHLWHDGDSQTQPYNLLVTRRLMFMVPRLRECFHDISLNALAFAGAFLVHSDDQLRILEQAGLWTALRSVARLPASPASPPNTADLQE